MMKKLILISILVIIVLISGCKKEMPAAPETPPAIPSGQETPPPIPETDLTNETPATPEAPMEVKTPGLEMVSQARCIDNKIGLVVTNPTNQTLTLAKDAKVIVNGLTVIDPECDKMEIKPGESVFCADISGHYATRTGEQNRIQINMFSERSMTVVNCEGQK